MGFRQEELFIRVEVGQKTFDSPLISKNNLNENFPQDKVFQRHEIVNLTVKNKIQN